jgi:hypothetical protein
LKREAKQTGEALVRGAQHFHQLSSFGTAASMLDIAGQLADLCQTASAG